MPRVLFVIFFLAGCAAIPPHSQRSLIVASLDRLNEAENRSLDIGLEQKIAGIDDTMADSWEGWSNGVHAQSRSDERETERVLFSVFPDYRRTFDLIVVDPPFANVLWTITGTASTNGYKLRMKGSTTFEFDTDGMIIRSWLHTGQMPAPRDVGIER